MSGTESLQNPQSPSDRHPWSRYVAMGDSFTEGIGDPEPSSPGGYRGWADRVAEELGAATTISPMPTLLSAAACSSRSLTSNLPHADDGRDRGR